MEEESDIDDEFLEELLTADNGINVNEHTRGPSAQNGHAETSDSFSSELRKLDSEARSRRKSAGTRVLDDIGNRAASTNHSLLHVGDTDSSDDEDRRNHQEAKLSDYGRSVKTLMTSSPTPREYPGDGRRASPSWSANRAVDKSTFAAPCIRPSKELVDTDPVFGMRIINPLVSGSGLRERMVGRTPVPMAGVKQFTASCKDKDTDWVIAGVLVSKSPIRTSQKGKKYCIWKLSDLKGILKSVTVFLFSSAYKNLWKTVVGTVLAILNPSVIDNRDSSDEAALSVDKAEKVMVLGASKDYGICKATKKNGDKCTAYVNKSAVDVCIYHMTREYQKCSRRSELQAPMPRVNLRNKVLGKNEVFYGGRSFMSQPRVQNRKHVARDEARLKGLSDGRGKTQPAKPNRQTAARLEAVNQQRRRDAHRLAILAGGITRKAEGTAAASLSGLEAGPTLDVEEALGRLHGENSTSTSPAVGAQRRATAPVIRKVGKLSFGQLERPVLSNVEATEELATGELVTTRNVEKESSGFLVDENEADERLAREVAERKARKRLAREKREERGEVAGTSWSPTTSPDRKMAAGPAATEAIRGGDEDVAGPSGLGSGNAAEQTETFPRSASPGVDHEAIVAAAVGDLGDLEFVEDWLEVEATRDVDESPSVGEKPAQKPATEMTIGQKSARKSATETTDGVKSADSKVKSVDSKVKSADSKVRSADSKVKSSGGRNESARKPPTETRPMDLVGSSEEKTKKGDETRSSSSAVEYRLLRKHRERMKAKKEAEEIVVPDGIRLNPRLNPEEMKPKEDIVLPSAKSFLMSMRNGDRRPETVPTVVTRKPSSETRATPTRTKDPTLSSTQFGDFVPRLDSSRSNDFVPRLDSSRSSDFVPRLDSNLSSDFVPRLDSGGCSAPRPGLGNFNGLIDFSTPIPKNRIEQAKMKAVQWVRQNGGLAKPNPSDKTGNSIAVKRKMEDWETDVGATEKARRLEEAVKQAKFVALMDVKSRHADLLVVHDDQEKEAYFDKLERKEKMEEQMSQTFSIKCKAVTCVECKYTAFSAAEICRSDGHRLKVTDGTKRFFRCADCSNRTVTLQRLPSATCSKCRSSRWERAPMMRERKPETTSVPLSIRGAEEKFIGSLQSAGNIDLLVPM